MRAAPDRGVHVAHDVRYGGDALDADAVVDGVQVQAAPVAAAANATAVSVDDARIHLPIAADDGG